MATQAGGIAALLGRGAAGAGRLAGGPLGIALMALMFWPELQSMLKNVKRGARKVPGGRALLGPGEDELAKMEKQLMAKVKGREKLAAQSLMQLLTERESQISAREGPGEEYFASLAAQGGLEDIASRFDDTAAPQLGGQGTKGGGLIQAEDAEEIQSALQAMPIDEDDPVSQGMPNLIQ